MSIFDDLRATNEYLYRGSHGDALYEVMSLAVGPVRKVAEYIRKNSSDIDDDLRDDATDYFRWMLFSRDSYVHAPGDRLADRLGVLLTTPGVKKNVFTAFEHVLYEPEGQVNSPRTARLLESVSEKPKIAILYAYGLNPDDWFDSRSANYWRGDPNDNAFVAVLPSSTGLSKDKALSCITQIAGLPKMTKDEAKRRMERDSEVLLTKEVVPVKLVELPEFKKNDVEESLNEAACKLIEEEVAQ